MTFDLVLLYVENPTASVSFYSKLLGGARILENSENFAMMPLREGMLLGLWKKEDVQPKVTVPTGGSELALKVDDEAELTKRHKELVAQNIRIVQEPTDMDFGRTFVALDADGNRLRFYASNRR